VGVHGRNHEIFHDIDFQVIRDARAEVVKMMSQTGVEAFERIKHENPGIEIITRLYDGRMNKAGHPTPAEFAAEMIPIMKRLQPYCTKFQVANEPNHLKRIEGWGPTNEDAQSFNQWFLEVYDLLKAACPWASLGFPGLAVPLVAHGGKAWVDACRPAVQRADWLGVHCYWQTPPEGPSVIFSEDFGLTFKYYHQQFPSKTLEILECGNSNVQSDWHKHWAIPAEDVAQEYVAWLQEAFKHDYINSASFFILSSEDPDWSFFAWRTEHNWVKPVVQQVGQMHRPPLRQLQPPPPQLAAMAEIAVDQYTNQHVITAFHNAAAKLGLDSWDLLERAGIELADLVKDRNAPYSGLGVDQLPNLAEEQKQLIESELAALIGPVEPGVSFGLPVPLEEGPAFLWQRADLTTIPLALPRSQHLGLAPASTEAEQRVARVWNQHGYLLTRLADILEIAPDVAVAVLASKADRPGFAADGRLIIRFENHIFFEKWGRQNLEQFQRHFRFEPSQPWQKHQWRPAADGKWINGHRGPRSEWRVFEYARTLDETAAKLSIRMGCPQTMGFNYEAAGYASVGQMFDAFSSSERYHILGFFDLIGGPSATSWQLQALRAQDLHAYAALHCGSAQAAKQGSVIRGLLEAFQNLKPV